MHYRTALVLSTIVQHILSLLSHKLIKNPSIQIADIINGFQSLSFKCKNMPYMDVPYVRIKILYYLDPPVTSELMITGFRGPIFAY